MSAIKPLDTLDTLDLNTVRGGAGLWGTVASGARTAGRFAVNAFRPAEPLANSKAISDYAGQIGKYGTIASGAAEAGSRATGNGSIFFPGSTPTPPTSQ